MNYCENPCLFSQKTTSEIKKLASDPRSLVILPLGSVEQHGPHLPVGTDTFILEFILYNTCMKSKYRDNILILPTIPYGFSHLHISFPGTISIEGNLLSEFITSIGRFTLNTGFIKLLMLSWHGGNYCSMHDAAYALKKEFPKAFIAYISFIELIIKDVLDLVKPPIYHADDLETSIMLAIGGRVLEKELEELKKKHEHLHHSLGDLILLDFAKRTRVRTPVLIEEYASDGIIGDLSQSSLDKGVKIIEIAINNLTEVVDKIVLMGVG
ncbi:MAG: creatininase family protein [Sulfolobales archaeon]|nr:creatininase family protein [Sulfolobales archaeon]MCX8198482.1 creatininase family protein [Sulfolobales archaeon]MDW8169557.1 creatininase family protein [Desulfurococcaceae archaeon]